MGIMEHQVLGYNPPYQLFDEKNEIIVTVVGLEFKNEFLINQTNDLKIITRRLSDFIN